MRIEPLRDHEQANARVIYEGSNIYLQSYSTIVLEYNPIDKTILCNGLYSATTRRHIGWFMKQFFRDKYSYHDIKACYLNDELLRVGDVC